MTELLLRIVADDWINVLLLLTVLFMMSGFLTAMLVPAFGGPWTMNTEMPKVAWLVARILAFVPMALYALVWLGRGILWLARAAICPC